jgi:hypothetical protein
MQQLLLAAAAAIAGSSNNPVDLSDLDGATLADVTSGWNISFDSDGELRWDDGTGGSLNIGPAGNWHSQEPSAGLGNGFDVRLVVNTGPAPTSGSTNTWLALSSDRQWTFNTDDTYEITVDIRRSSGAVLATATFDLTVSTVSP